MNVIEYRVVMHILYKERTVHNFLKAKICHLCSMTALKMTLCNTMPLDNTGVKFRVGFVTQIYLVIIEIYHLRCS